MAGIEVDWAAYRTGILPAIHATRDTALDKVDKAVDRGLETAIALCPVRHPAEVQSDEPPGSLLASTHRTPLVEEFPGIHSAELVAGEGLRYAVYVEMGTAKHGGPQPFMRPAAAVIEAELA